MAYYVMIQWANSKHKSVILVQNETPLFCRIENDMTHDLDQLDLMIQQEMEQDVVSRSMLAVIN